MRQAEEAAAYLHVERRHLHAVDPGEKGVEVGGVEAVAGRVDAAQIVTGVPV